MANAELRQGSSDLRLRLLGDRLAGFRGVEVMAAAVGVELAEQPVSCNHLGQAAKARGRALFLHHKGRIDRAGRVIQGDHQVVLPSVPRQPGKTRGIPRFREGRL